MIHSGSPKAPHYGFIPPGIHSQLRVQPAPSCGSWDVSADSVSQSQAGDQDLLGTLALPKVDQALTRLQYTFAFKSINGRLQRESQCGAQESQSRRQAEGDPRCSVAHGCDSGLAPVEAVCVLYRGLSSYEQ